MLIFGKMCKYKFLLAPLLLFSLSARSQTICDSVFIQPAVFYLTQPTDSLVYDTLTYTGQRDISYSNVYFKFQDSTYIIIHDNSVTHGVAGPFTYSYPFGYKIIYKMANIPANTIVNAHYGVYHAGNPSPIIDCLLPVTFVINPVAGLQAHSDPQLNVFPNPLASTLEIRLEHRLQNGSAAFFNAVGEQVKFIANLQGRTLSLRHINLVPGVYFLELKDKDQIIGTKKIVISQDGVQDH